MPTGLLSKRVSQSLPFLSSSSPLIQVSEYAEALMWDQLKMAMADPEINPFPGFEEGPINFPCTFKYDVCYISFSVISMIIMSAHHLCIYNRYGNPSAQLTARSGGTSNAANPPPLLHQLTLILLKSPLPTLVMVVAVVVKQVGTRSL